MKKTSSIRFDPRRNTPEHSYFCNMLLIHCIINKIDVMKLSPKEIENLSREFYIEFKKRKGIDSEEIPTNPL